LNPDAGASPLEPGLERALAGLAAEAHPDMRVGARAIRPGDEDRLTPLEAAPLARATAPVRRASGAARIVAQRLLGELGFEGEHDLARLASGAPAWPPGFVGSLAHDEAVAVAAVAPAGAMLGVGIDVEPSLPLPAELLAVVATPAERAQLGGDLVAARLLFCMKEAVYKATNPVDGLFLDHQDVEICLSSHIAATQTGRRLRLHVATAPRLLALTILERP